MILSDVDPNLMLHGVQPLQEQVDAEFDQQRAVARMTGIFGILALILAAVGLYGVTAYTVERRTSEIGVRMAMGANRGNVVGLVLRGAFLQILIGLAIGIPLSIGCAKLIAAQLYHVKGWDPVVLMGSILPWDWRADRQHHPRAAGGVHQPGTGVTDGIAHPGPPRSAFLPLLLTFDKSAS